MYKCTRVESIQGEKKYYCFNFDGGTHVLNKAEMIKLIQKGLVMNASTYIRNGSICIRVDDAIKEKAVANKSTESTVKIEDKIIKEIIKEMQKGLVYFEVKTEDFYDSLNLPEFKLSISAMNLVPKNLVLEAKDICDKRGQTAYIMGIHSEEGSGYDIIFATTNKKRGCMAIQNYIKDTIINESAKREMSPEEVKIKIEEMRKRVRFTA